MVLLAYDYGRGIRYTQTRKRRTKADYAEFMQQIVSTYYADMEYIDLVQDKGTDPPAKYSQVWFILRAFAAERSPCVEPETGISFYPYAWLLTVGRCRSTRRRSNFRSWLLSA